jgi:N-acetylglutamate synthase
MTIADYEEVLALWQSLDGIGLHDHEDSREAIACYLDRNPGLSFVARCDGRLVGSILCGHDGRRGMINHLSVHPEYRNQAVGRSLVDLSLSQLAKVGVRKCNIVVKSDNNSGQEVWNRLGWHTRPDLVFMQKQTG